VPGFVEAARAGGNGNMLERETDMGMPDDYSPDVQRWPQATSSAAQSTLGVCLFVCLFGGVTGAPRGHALKF
jgi:hypothetical protein